MSSVFPGRLTCELEGSAWEFGSSDGAAPEPMGLSVVIRLGWPRSVRVMVVGTFKPDREGRKVVFGHSLHFLLLESFFTSHTTPSASHLSIPSWVIYALSVSLKGNRKQLCSFDLSGGWSHTAESLRINTRTDPAELGSTTCLAHMRWEGPGKRAHI